MNDWYKYWNDISIIGENTEYLKQVGHTIAGKPYSKDIFNALVMNIRDSLSLHQHDVVLDLCCGNGVITAQLSPHCKSITGLDFSIPLIDIANQVHKPANTFYFRQDVLELKEIKSPEDGLFNKILMYGALQHFQKQDLEPLLVKVFKLSAIETRMLIGGIPDIRRRNQFLDSFGRKLQFAIRKLLGRDQIGAWWNPDDLKNICSRQDLNCVIVDTPQGRPGSHYRFDAIISRRTR